jgi:hypothetical protein
MTTLTVARSPETRPVPLSQMAWVVWRRFRTTLIASIGVLAVLAIYLVIHGEQMRSAYSKFLACQPANSASCNFVWQNFRNMYGGGGFVVIVLLFLPGLIGAFAGAPLLARELETGTFRYAWTQGIGRMRWAVTVVLTGALAVAVLVGLFGILVSWHDGPLFAGGLIPRLRPAGFPTMGIATAGWALVGYALGVFIGVLWRRVIPTLATALAVWFGLALLTANELRPHYLAPIKTTSMDFSGQSIIVSQWWTKGGVRVASGALNSVLNAVGLQQLGGSGKVTVQPNSPTTVDPVQYLLQHGFRQVTAYQPGSRYWTFQWIEFGWLLALSLALIAAALWLLRRRPS